MISLKDAEKHLVLEWAICTAKQGIEHDKDMHYLEYIYGENWGTVFEKATLHRLQEKEQMPDDWDILRVF